MPSMESLSPLPFCKAPPGFFFCIFSSLTCLKKPVFSKQDLPRWTVPVRIYWDLSDQRKVPASLSLFLKSEKIPALLYIRKGPSTGPSVIFDLFPWPTGLGHRSQITKGPIFRPLSYTQNLFEIVKSGGEGFVMSIIPLSGSDQEGSTILPQN